MNNKGLGRGLSSLIPPKQNNATMQAQIAASSPDLRASSSMEIIDIPLSSIDPNPQQPRQHFDPKNLDELAQSIETYGLLEPIVVVAEGDRWHIVAGERRFRAFTQLQRATIPVIVRTATDLERLELAMIENIQREDLNPIERAEGYAKLVNDFGLTQQVAAQKMGIARSSIANAIRLLDLPTEIQIGLAEGKITEGHGKVLLGLKTEKEQMDLYKQMTSGSAMSVRDLSDAVAGGNKQKSRRRVGDFELQQVEEQLQSSLGTKVSIKKKAGGKHQIIIDTFSDEEFKSVVKKIRT